MNWSWKKWLRRSTPTSATTPATRTATGKPARTTARSPRLTVEALEDRIVPATVPVVSMKFNDVLATPAITTAFVQDLYLDTLYRAPSASELSAMTTALANKSLTPGGAFASLVNGTEYKNSVLPLQTIYEAYLGRRAEPQGLGGWVNYNRGGGASLTQIAQQIAGTAEFQQDNGNIFGLSNDAFVNFLYQKDFGRTPSANERAGWVNQLNLGVGRGDLVYKFTVVPEFAMQQPNVTNGDIVAAAYLGLWNEYPDASFNSYVTGLNNGTIKDAAALGTQFIDGAPYLGLGAIRNYILGLYEGFLKRDPELAGYRGWRIALANGIISDAQLFAFIVNSNEYQATNPTPTSTATLAYQTIVGRAPTPTELTTAIGYLNAGNPAGLATLLLNSNDFTKNSYSQNIQHTVVIYQENWSFDGLYGNFPGATDLNNVNTATTVKQIDDATGQVIYVNPPPTNPAGSANFPDQGYSTGTPDPNFPPTDGQSSLPAVPFTANNYIQPSQLTGDIIHAFYHEQLQLDNGVLESSNGQNDKFITWSTNPGLVMSNFDTSTLPEFQLAKQYTMDDDFFHSAYGGSFLNHQYLVAAAAPQWNQAMPTSTTTFQSFFIAITPVTNETDTNAGGSATAAYTLSGAASHTPLAFAIPETVTGTISIAGTVAYNFSVNAQNVVTLTPVGTPSTTINSATFSPTTDVLTVNWAANPGATSITVSYKYGRLNDSNLSNPSLTTVSPQGATLNGTTTYLVNTSFGAQAPIPTSAVTNETDSNAGGAASATYTFAHVSVYPGTVSGSVFIGASTTAAYNFTINAAGVVALVANGTPAVAINTASFNATTGVLTLNWASNPGATSVKVSYHYGVISRDQLLQPINDTNPQGAAYETTIGDELNAAGVSWKWYSGGWNAAVAGNATSSSDDALFQFHHQPFAYFANYAPFNADGTLNTTNLSQAHLQDEQNYMNDVAADNGAMTTTHLPSVVFIKPEGQNNEHPGYTDIADGQNHEMQLVNTIQNSVDWSNSNIVITYDENGGRWDQVNPPMIDQWGVGTRVPGIEVSPFARRGFVDHQQLETDSILATIESQYNLSSMAVHDKQANTLYSAYDFSPSDVLKNNHPAVSALPNFLPLSGGFTAGDVVVSQIGNGNDPLKSADLAHDLSAPVTLDQFTLGGTLTGQLSLPSTTAGANHGIVTSGGSKSEGGLTLSSDGHYLTYIGYDTTNLANAIGTSDISKLSTAGGPNVTVNRDIARISATGAIDTTTSLGDAYQGDNARDVASIDGAEFFSVGNSDNSKISTIGPRYSTLGATTSTLLGTVTGTPSKNDNFRSVQIFNGNVYTAKGSGGTGSNGIFLVGPTSSTSGGETTTALPGLSQVVGSDGPNVIHPFGFFFANATTLYIADEGFEQQVNPNDPTTFAASPKAGIQKWILSGGTWTLAYTLTTGLNLGKQTTIAGVTSWTEGLRNLAAQLNADGTVTLLAVTAQSDSNSNTGDADPNALVKITDVVAATTQPAGESFVVTATAPANTVFRGVAFAPK
jgi:phospholipase C